MEIMNRVFRWVKKSIKQIEFSWRNRNNNTLTNAISWWEWKRGSLMKKNGLWCEKCRNLIPFQKKYQHQCYDVCIEGSRKVYDGKRSSYMVWEYCAVLKAKVIYLKNLRYELCGMNGGAGRWWKGHFHIGTKELVLKNFE